MPVKVLLMGIKLFGNLGGPSLLITTKKVLDKSFDKTIEYKLISNDEKGITQKYDIDAIFPPAPIIKLIIPIIAQALFNVKVGNKEIRKFVTQISESDMLIDISGIRFSDKLGYNTFGYRLKEGIPYILYGKIFRKPVIKYTADLGPFQTRWNRIFSKFYLNYFTDLIFARGETTVKRLKQLNIKTPVYLAPDTAFLLEPVKTRMAEFLINKKKDGPIIGFSTSHMAARQSNNPEKYCEIMADFADYIIESTGAYLVFIPNELYPEKDSSDKYISQKVINKMKNSGKTLLIDEEYTAPELKGIISQFDVAVAARYHTIVACLSLGIPVLAIGWHTKYYDVLNIFGLQEYLCEVNLLNNNDLKRIFNRLWDSREELKELITHKLPGAHKSIYKAGEILVNSIKVKAF